MLFKISSQLSISCWFTGSWVIFSLIIFSLVVAIVDVYSDSPVLK